MFVYFLKLKKEYKYITNGKKIPLIMIVKQPKEILVGALPKQKNISFRIGWFKNLFS